MRELIADAVRCRFPLSFTYDDKVRIVEPHALGKGSKGQLLLRAYQRDGDSDTKPQAWKLFSCEKIQALRVIASQPFENPRAGYNSASDPALAEIIAKVD